jgi:taurine--2-oxoglutarate transaminase
MLAIKFHTYEAPMDEILDSDILSQSLEHSFWTWSAQGSIASIPVTRAKGGYFWDESDKRYLDFNSMLMCVNIVHGDQRVIDANEEYSR